VGAVAAEVESLDSRCTEPESTWGVPEAQQHAAYDRHGGDGHRHPAADRSEQWQPCGFPPANFAPFGMPACWGLPGDAYASTSPPWMHPMHFYGMPQQGHSQEFEAERLEAHAKQLEAYARQLAEAAKQARERENPAQQRHGGRHNQHHHHHHFDRFPETHGTYDAFNSWGGDYQDGASSGDPYAFPQGARCVRSVQERSAEADEVWRKQTLGAHLAELRDHDPSCIFIVRRLGTLGFQSRELLLAHYALFGEVSQVLVPHSKAIRDRNAKAQHLRIRPGSFGFVVMGDLETCQRVLGLGKEQDVSGQRVVVEPFRRVAQTKATSTGAEDGLEGELAEYQYA